jgi:hypothetical protein
MPIQLLHFLICIRRVFYIYNWLLSYWNQILSLIGSASSVYTVSDCRLNERGSIPCRSKGKSLCVQTALRPTQPPIQWVSAVLSRG